MVDKYFSNTLFVNYKINYYRYNLNNKIDWVYLIGDDGHVIKTCWEPLQEMSVRHWVLCEHSTIENKNITRVPTYRYLVRYIGILYVVYFASFVISKSK